MTLYDGLKFTAGQTFSQDALAAETRACRLAAQRNPSFRCRSSFWLEDTIETPMLELQHMYFDKIEAPYKRFRWFENSAHSPPFEEQEAFNAFMVRDVLPIARAHG